MKPCRVLFTQMAEGGGSAVSMRELALLLRGKGYEPHVLVFREGRQCEELRDAGLRVRTLEGADGPSYRQAIATRPLRSPKGGHEARGGGGDSIPTEESGLRSARAGAKDLLRLVTADWPLSTRILHVINEIKPVIVHHNNSIRGERAPVLAALRARTPNVGHVRWIHRYRWLDRRLGRRCSHFIYISKAVAESCAVLGARGSLVYNPIPLPAGLTEDGRERLRQSLGFGSGDAVVCSVGRLVGWKGHDVFLTAMAIVMRDKPAARAVIVGAEGSTPDSRGVEDELHLLARTLGIADRVVFTGHRRDVSDLMTASDLVVHSAVRPEPFGRVVTEAMACAKPVVATRGGGVLEIVEDGVTGTLVSMGDAEDMARGISGLLGDPAQAAAMGEAGREVVRTRFSPEQHLAGVEAVYKAALTTVGKTAEAGATVSSAG